jgi:hypothetical protein
VVALTISDSLREEPSSHQLFGGDGLHPQLLNNRRNHELAFKSVTFFGFIGFQDSACFDDCGISHALANNHIYDAFVAKPDLYVHDRNGTRSNAILEAACIPMDTASH